MNNSIEIGVLGAGSMGSGIAQVAATVGHRVVLYDQYKSAIEKSEQKLQKIFNRLVEKGKYTQEQSTEILNRIRFASSDNSIQECKNCSLVIEAIVENVVVKQAVFKELETIVSQDCVLATNTSSLSVTSIASACEKPERVIGIHFFNPAPLMPLVEIIPCIQTGEEQLTKSRALIDSWGKTTVLAKDTPGFIVNRVARPFYGEAIRIYEEGIADFATIDWAMKEIGGFRMGPFELMDYIGNDVNYTVTETVFEAFYYDPRYRPSFTQKRYKEAGWLGRKTGKGYYQYGENSENPSPDKNQNLGEKIVNRVVAMLINEAADALFLNIASKQDLDLAMTKGVNYPKGLLKWADEIGIEECLSRLEKLQSHYGEDRYRPSPLLRNMAEQSRKFYV